MGESRFSRLGFWVAAVVLMQACFMAPQALCRAEADCGDGMTCSDGTCVAEQTTQPGSDGGDGGLTVPEVFDPFWSVETVSNGGTAANPTLRLTSGGTPEIAFWTSEPGTFSFVRSTVAMRVGSTWDVRTGDTYDLLASRFEVLRGGPDHTFTVAHGGRFDFAELNGSALDRYRLMDSAHAYGDAFDAVMASDGKLHGLTRTTGKLLYFVWDGDRTQVQLQMEDLGEICVDDGVIDNCPAFLHVDVDASGEPRALFRGETDTTLTWARRTAGQWEFDALPSSVEPGVVSWSAAGEPTVCFARDGVLVGSTTIRCMRNRGGQWTQHDVFVNQKDTLAWVYSVRESSDGTLHLLFAEELSGGTPAQRVTWARLDGTSWALQPLFTTEGASAPLPRLLAGGDLVLDSGGAPHVAVGFGGRLYYLRPAP